MRCEIKLSNVPDGAMVEDYLGASRFQPTKREAAISRVYIVRHVSDLGRDVSQGRA